MFFKLALSNVKKSIRDYTIYFLTLSFGVCIFYIFNSIESQQAMMEINESKGYILKSLSEVIGYVSIFVSVILGFLILFANKFLLKRRKKELGIYMTLGMEKGKISRMFILETMVIGIISLIAGLVAGVFISQGLSVVTAKLFEANMKAYQFIFSYTALIKSIIYFGIIYIIVMIFNTISISRYKLITLLQANRQNEKLKVKSLWLSVVLFIISACCLGIAYYLIIQNQMLQSNMQFYTCILLGFVGTLLFFMSLSGFFLRVLKSNKDIYFKGLNIFVLRQLNSKINTTFLSMTVICLMLLIAIGTLSSGVGLANAFSGNLKDTTQYDVSFQSHTPQEAGHTKGIYDALKEDGLRVEELFSDYALIKYYKTDLTYELFYNEIKNPKGRVKGMLNNPKFKEQASKTFVKVISLSDFNNALKMQGKEPIELAPNQFVMNCNMEDAQFIYEDFFVSKKELSINGIKLTAKWIELYNYTLQTSMVKMDDGTVIVPDEVIKNTVVLSQTLNANFINAKISEEFLEKEISKVYQNGKTRPYQYYSTKVVMYEQAVGLKAAITYITIYIGIVFLITCAAVLALQQLSEATDNMQRYRLLRKFGTEEKMINKALFWQILIYFMAPLVLAISHSVVGIYVANNIITTIGNMNILKSIVVIALVFLIVYGGYFVATYISSKNIIKPQKN